MADSIRSRIVRRRRRGRRRGLTRYLGRGEVPVLSTRQHPFALVRAGLDTLGLVAPLLLAAWGVAGIELLRGTVGSAVVRGLLVLAALCILRAAWRVLAWEFERVIVTEEKVIHVEGVLQRRIASTPLAKVSEFTVQQPLLGRIFDYGSLIVDVPGGREQALHGLAFLPDPAGLYRLISDLARSGRTREGGGREPSGHEVVRVPVPSALDVERLEEPPAKLASPPRPDPWSPTLSDADADFTIQIPRVPPER